MSGLKVKVSDSLDNVPNENVVTHLGTDRQTNIQTDQLHELLEWLFATKNPLTNRRVVVVPQAEYLEILLSLCSCKLVPSRRFIGQQVTRQPFQPSLSSSSELMEFQHISQFPTKVYDTKWYGVIQRVPRKGD